VALDILSALPLIVLKLPPHRAKGITYSNIGVFMGMPLAMLPTRDNLAPRRTYLDVDLIGGSVMTMLVRPLDDHAAVNYIGAELLEALSQLPYTRFKSRRRLGISPSDLN
jgi:hypothetical protein